MSSWRVAIPAGTFGDTTPPDLRLPIRVTDAVPPNMIVFVWRDEQGTLRGEVVKIGPESGL